MIVNVLGTPYEIHERSLNDDRLLENCDGYCDKTTKTIVVLKRPDDSDLGNFDVYRKKVMRHEIIHAFLFESGLHECWNHKDGHDEAFVDWIAVQFRKLLQAFKEADVL